MAFKEASLKRSEITQTIQAPLNLYLECAKTYRRVHVKDPHYIHTAAAIYEEGLIYQEMGERFSDPELYKKAARRFELLVKDYAGHKNCPDALLRLSDIYRNHLNDETAAQNAYQTLTARYKSSGVAHKLPQKETTPKPLPERLKPAESDQPAGKPLVSLIKSIRHWSAEEYTRVIIDMDSDAEYFKERLSNPGRIYFDVTNARLGRNLQMKAIPVEDEFLRQIRISSRDKGTIRIVLDLTQNSDYSISELRNPFRITVDLYKRGTISAGLGMVPPAPRTGLAIKTGKDASKSSSAQEAVNRAPSKEKLKALDVDIKKDAAEPKSNIRADIRKTSAGNSSFQDTAAKDKEQILESGKNLTGIPPAILLDKSRRPPPRAVTELSPKPNIPGRHDSVPLTQTSLDMPASGVSKNIQRQADSSVQSNAPKAVAANPIMTAKVMLPPLPSQERKPASLANQSTSGLLSNLSTSKEPEAKKTDLESIISQNPKAAPPTSRGDRTLTRILGLKIGRIVLDPGHGGHDLGTVGPGGLLEKDLVLSLALELQKLLQENLGAEVILTRYDDVFIPLEERTAIANRYKADLFISIHANSSRSRSISGVETYYLDFAKTKADREIAARENATATNNIHELENLIKKIAQADKAAESRELALMVQRFLYSGAKRAIPSTQNRGVRCAPFIVLIDAKMPSILAEVAFLSNPSVEKLLKRSANQESLAKALFSGIEGYVKTLGSEFVQNQIPIK
ncbi:MAG: N-acetylmuramoyl-L-alanine amidase [Acidobacteria bacterium]|nr:N-acetylmuramoyl-L-alanine amidase [Acidobacteriota bacterium]